MSVNLSIKNAPDEMVELLRRRAQRNHRSLQGELMSIISEAAQDEDVRLTPSQIVAGFRAKGYSSPEEAVDMIREDRDRADRRH